MDWVIVIIGAVLGLILGLIYGMSRYLMNNKKIVKEAKTNYDEGKLPQLKDNTQLSEEIDHSNKEGETSHSESQVDSAPSLEFMDK